MATTARKKLTPLQKKRKLAVKVCKDMLKRLGEYKNVAGGLYCNSRFWEYDTDGDYVENDNMRAIARAKKPLVKARKHCRVCAMGALFLEALEIDGSSFPLSSDGLELVRQDRVDRTDIVRVLAPAFSPTDLDDIEVTFEADSDTLEMRGAGDWPGLDGSRERLIAILERIIKDGGKVAWRARL